MSRSLPFVVFLFLSFHPTSINANKQPRINDDKFRPVIYAFFVVGALNAIGCSFVFYKTFIKWSQCKKDGKELTMAYRLPFYTAIASTKQVEINSFCIIFFIIYLYLDIGMLISGGINMV